MNQKKLLTLIIVCLNITGLFAQNNDMVNKAVIVNNGKAMQIGDKTYNIYLSSDPIAPTAGWRIIDFAGVLPYYMWVHKGSDGYFTISIIDENLNIYYFDKAINKFYNDTNKTIIYEGTGKIEVMD